MRPLKEKVLVIVIGPPGSGKTSLAREHQGYIMFDNDRVIEAVWGALQYHGNIKRLCKGMVREGIRRAMEAGLAIVIPISGRTKKERAKYVALGKEHGYRAEIVRAMATEGECLARCKADESRPKTTDWQPIIERWFKVFESVTDGECDKYLEVSPEMTLNN